jgi:hypothetical protein
MRRPPARRRDLLALHRRHAGRVRAVFYWLGADLEILDASVQRTFLLAGHLTDDPASRPALGLLAWRVASRPAAHPPRRPSRRDRVVAPHLPPAADALARFLADHAAAPLARGLFVLSEFTGVDPDAFADDLRGPPELATTLRAALVELRLAFADDPEVQRHGGPRAVLAASLAPFVDDAAWQHQHAAALARQLPGPPDLAELLRHRAAIVTLGALAVAALLLARPGRSVPLRAVAIREEPPAPTPTPTLRIFPPVPAAMPPAPGPPRHVVRTRSARRPTQPDTLAARERLAKTRDPGAIIIELEMLGAARKSLAANPRQSLAYADQHARDYPDSQLVDQRAEVRVRALCALARPADARAEAAARNTPRVQTALREACR